MEIRNREHLEVLFEIICEQVEIFIADEMKDHSDFEASEFLLNEIDILKNTDPSEYMDHKIIPAYVDKNRVYPYEWDTTDFSSSAIAILEGFNESALHAIKESKKSIKIGLQSRNLEQVRRRPKRPKKNPSKESTLESMLKKRRG